MNQSAMTFEQGPIRPPSEAASLLIRLTRNCPWNRCLFCPVYKTERFSRRSLEEIKLDIETASAAAQKILSLAQRNGGAISRGIIEQVRSDSPASLPVAIWLYRGAGTVFLQDADSMLMPTDQLAEILDLVVRRLPGVKRITTYGRSRSIIRKDQSELDRLKRAGLSRIHIGLESGCDPVLSYMRKGVTAAQHREAGIKVKAAGISLSEYVILGLGGASFWREHALETAAVLNAINPDYIRLRTLAIHPLTPLYREWEEGGFIPLDDEGILREEQQLLGSLDGIESTILSDHILNLLEEIAGTLPEDRSKMLNIMERYFTWPVHRRELFRLGRRAGLYRSLDDCLDPLLTEQVERLYRRIKEEGLSVDQYTRQLMLSYL